MIFSDDEYRLLRQSVFEQYSGNASVPVERPLVPISAINGQRGCEPLTYILFSHNDIDHSNAEGVH